MGWNLSCTIALSSSQTSLETWSFAIVIGEGAMSHGFQPAFHPG